MAARLRLRTALANVAIALTCVFAPVASVANAATGVPERIPFKQDDDDFGAATWRAVLGTTVIALLAVGAVYFMRRRGYVPAAAPDGAKPVRIVQTLRAGPKTSLLVVQFGGQRVLLGQSEHGLQVLATEPAETP